MDEQRGEQNRADLTCDVFCENATNGGRHQDVAGRCQHLLWRQDLTCTLWYKMRLKTRTLQGTTGRHGAGFAAMNRHCGLPCTSSFTHVAVSASVSSSSSKKRAAWVVCQAPAGSQVAPQRNNVQSLF